MAIVLDDVKSPVGEVNGAVWFPALVSGDVDDLLEGFITDAVARTADEDSQALWVYYRAATEVADRMTVTPASTTKSLVDQGSKSTTTIQAQIDYWVAKAAGYLAAFTENESDETTADAISGWSKISSLRHSA